VPGTRKPEARRREQILRAAYEVAAREGLDGTTILQVAAEAGLSAGLVPFHFGSKRQLLLSLLDWLLETTTVLHVGPEIARIAAPTERLLALLRQEMARLSGEPQRIRLTFDFWTAGIRDEPVRERMRTEFARYRLAFRPIVEAVIAAEPQRFEGVTPEGLAAVAVSFIKGCAVQSMIDPERFDIAEDLTAAESLLARLGDATPGGPELPAGAAAGA
jgi:TetR/AcrR family transcriptional regulator, transcriptional repressor of bet genes